MIMRKGEHPVECRENAHGGAGFVSVTHLATAEQTFGHCRMLVSAVIEPGSEMGYHVHQNEAEFFYVLEGALEVFDGCETVVACPGDTVFTEEGKGHSLRAHGDRPAKYLAVVVKK